MRVALVGTHGESWRQAVDLDDTWEVWGLNNEYALSPRFFERSTRWFELHGNTPLTRARRPTSHWQRLAEFKGPIYTLFDLPAVKDARLFPIERAAGIRDYFSCTFAYQIALAMLEGVTDLRLYGTPLVGAREALVERPCVEWWLGYATGHEVNVEVIHDLEYGLGKQPYRYAFNDQAERYLAYRYAYAHHDDVVDWIGYEEMRLRIKRPMWAKAIRWAAAKAYGR